MGVITQEAESHELICAAAVETEAREGRSHGSPSSNQGPAQESPHGTQHVQARQGILLYEFKYVWTCTYKEAKAKNESW